MSEALVRLQRKGQLVIPRPIREEAGLSEGTLMKVSVARGGRVVLTPQVTVDRNGADSKDIKQAFRDLAQVVAEIRQESKEKGLDKMPMSEIRAAVNAMRRDHKKKASKRPAK